MRFQTCVAGSMTSLKPSERDDQQFGKRPTRRVECHGHERVVCARPGDEWPQL
jgi:hypothetical protein